MGIFQRLEKWFGGERAEANYVCVNCEATLAANRQQCPECGSGDIRLVEFTDSELGAV